MPTDKEFEDFFREQFQGLEETPPANGWVKIQEEIRPKTSIYKWLGTTFLVIVVSITALFTTLRHEARLQKQPKAETVALEQANPAKVATQEQAAPVTLPVSEPSQNQAAAAKPAQGSQPFSMPKGTITAGYVKAATEKGRTRQAVKETNYAQAALPVSENASARTTGLHAADKATSPEPHSSQISSFQGTPTNRQPEIEAIPATMQVEAEPEAETDTMGQMIQAVYYNPDKKPAGKKGLKRLFGKK
ncbi:hypothetical protein [Adhaeribacter soli]|uniref:Uncharacterized protein n=1 Tax=Adhaeribacter soli TaxID=2607655 RepID=A0A5N1IWV7_9BACT|nr:hypothetical protein [Adhaeribacter soli]KAA9333636.1 hypothetical protein F0P94_10315 [Adhaeribacter soli]